MSGGGDEGNIRQSFALLRKVWETVGRIQHLEFQRKAIESALQLRAYDQLAPEFKINTPLHMLYFQDDPQDPNQDFILTIQQHETVKNLQALFYVNSDEYLLAKKTTIHAGYDSIDGSIFDGALPYVMNQLVEKLPRVPDKIRDSVFNIAISPGIGISRRRLHGKQQTFLELLDVCKYSEASNPRDKIYALLGLASDLPQGYHQVIDYDLSVFKIKVLVAQLFNDSRLLPLLSHVLEEPEDDISSYCVTEKQIPTGVMKINTLRGRRIDDFRKKCKNGSGVVCGGEHDGIDVFRDAAERQLSLDREFECDCGLLHVLTIACRIAISHSIATVWPSVASLRRSPESLISKSHAKTVSPAKTPFIFASSFSHTSVSKQRLPPSPRVNRNLATKRNSADPRSRENESNSEQLEKRSPNKKVDAAAWGLWVLFEMVLELGAYAELGGIVLIFTFIFGASTLLAKRKSAWEDAHEEIERRSLEESQMMEKFQQQQNRDLEQMQRNQQQNSSNVRLDAVMEKLNGGELQVHEGNPSDDIGLVYVEIGQK
ncbi:hypothetical protein G7Y89_g10116 [Cudoniella acicularis]|uniref:Uncharacterized protein n=1 Tax=Cudoniella acicularis TaxID=354080 RepID=A0A8H4REY5_9HELO|nr:hypothetical protein G7Y89_g10116 [Cudoniella acicularis]